MNIKKIIFFVVSSIIISAIVVAYIYISSFRDRDDDQKMILTENLTKNNALEGDTKNIFVWTFWEGTPSPLVDICLERIDKSCEEGSTHSVKYTHIHLSSKNLKEYLEDIDSFSCYAEGKSALKSDVIRLYLLKKYGGLWLDCSIFVLRSMDEIFPENDLNCFQAFFNPANYKETEDKYDFPIIETSAMYSPPNFPLVNDWFNETVSLEKCGDDEKKNYIKNTAKKNMMNLLNPYHYVYFTLANVLRKNNGIQTYKNIKLYNTRKYKFFALWTYGPRNLVYMSSNDFVSKHDIKDATMFKFTSYDRKFIDMFIGKSRPDCIIRNKNIDIYHSATKQLEH